MHTVGQIPVVTNQRLYSQKRNGKKSAKYELKSFFKKKVVCLK